MSRTALTSPVLLLTAVYVGATGHAAAESAIDAPPQQGAVLLLDESGRAVAVPVDSLPPGLRPSSPARVQNQTPMPQKGTALDPAVVNKLDAVRELLPQYSWFPAVPPALMPYLASQDELGNTLAHPGPLIDSAPLEAQLQGLKTWLSERGLRYSLKQSFTWSGMTDVMTGSDGLGNYNLDFVGKWAMFDARGAGGTAGWISAQIEYQAGSSGYGTGQSVQSNIGSLTNPLQFHSSHSGWRMPELAWQQSFGGGQWVALAGIVNQGNYLDGNGYANSGRGQFMNSALVNSQVLPLPSYDYGLNLQWQPSRQWYGMVGYSVGNAGAGEKPGTDFSWDVWSLEYELGYISQETAGQGRGIYRLQPFVARNGGPVQGGIAFNFEQQLGPTSPFGAFGRIGVGGSQVAGGAKAQIGAGVVMNAPLKYLGWVPRLSNDLLGVGFVWSQPSATTKTVYHQNETVLETFYTLQLTRTAILQPDLQLIWNPVFNPDSGPAVVFQVQAVLKW